MQVEATMSSVETGDAILILHRALCYLQSQGKNFTDHDDVFLLQSHKCSLFQEC